MLPLLQGADVTLLTLETVATTSDIHLPAKKFLEEADRAGARGSTSFHKMDPRNLQTLVTAGVDAVALATNHAVDYDVGGLLETTGSLTNMGIANAGVGADRSEALEPARISRGGVDIALFSFTDYINGFDRQGSDVGAATATRAGANYLNTHGIRRFLPFSLWDTNGDAVITQDDVDSLIARSEELDDPQARDWQEVFEFCDVGFSGSVTTPSDQRGVPSTVTDIAEPAGDGRVTVAEFREAMQGVEDGTRYDPGWLEYLQGVAAEITASRKHEFELVVVGVTWGSNWQLVAEWPSFSPDAAIQMAARTLIDGGVDIIVGGGSHNLLGVEVYRGSFIIYGAGPLVDDYWFRQSVRNDLAFLYHVEVDKSSPRQISNLRLTPLRREMMVGSANRDALQTNLLPRDDPDWLVLRDSFRQLCSGFGTVVQSADDTAELVVMV